MTVDLSKGHKCEKCGCWCTRNQDGDAPWARMTIPEVTDPTWSTLKCTDNSCSCHFGAGMWEAVGLEPPEYLTRESA